MFAVLGQKPLVMISNALNSWVSHLLPVIQSKAVEDNVNVIKKEHWIEKKNTCKHAKAVN